MRKAIPGAGRAILYVDCKYTSDEEQNSVTKDDVNAFIANFHSLKQAHGWTAGVMVSNKNFSQYAKAAAEPHADIFLRTVDDLYSDLFNMPSYLQSTIGAYEAEGVLADYVPLRTKTVSGDAGGTFRPKSLKALFDAWINFMHSPQLVLLGDFGAGKTTFMRYIHYECAKSFLSGSFDRMPILISLRDYYDVSDGRELIERFFSYELAAKIPYRVFDKFMHLGGFLLLLDGFDEMGVISDATIRQRNYLKLCRLITPNAKIVITCRPAYFVNNDELQKVFTFYERQVSSPHSDRGQKGDRESYEGLATSLHKASGMTKVSDLFRAIDLSSKNSWVAHIQLFDNSQIKSYLALHRDKIIAASARHHDDRSLLQIIKRVYDLEDLARRPILLKLITNTLPLFRQNTDGRYTISVGNRTQIFDEITPSVLYFVYTEGELSREYSKGEVRWQIDRDTRRDMISSIAVAMFSKNLLTLEPDELRSLVSRSFHGARGKRLDQLTTDVRTCSFLVLDRNDCLRFAHVAWEMLARLSDKGSANYSLSQRILPAEVLYFLGDLVGSFFPAYMKTLNEVLLGIGVSDICIHNILNLLTYARHPRTHVEEVNIQGLTYIKQEMNGLDLESTTLDNLQFSRSRIKRLGITNSSVKRTLVDGSVINEFSIHSSRLEGAEFSASAVHLEVWKSQLRNWQLTEMTLDHATIKQSTLVVGSCRNSLLQNATFSNVLISSSLTDAKLSFGMDRVLFDNCIFFQVDCDGDILSKATFRRCIFVRCHLSNRSGLSRLNGSLGFFLTHEKNDQNSENNRKEVKRNPVHWDQARADSEVKRFRGIVSEKSEDQMKARLSFLKKLAWEDVLAIAFPKVDLKNSDNVPTLEDAREKIRQTRDDLKLLCGSGTKFSDGKTKRRPRRTERASSGSS